MIAYVTHPNTPETDQETRVWHTVEYTVNGEKCTTEILAKDPLDAIRKMQITLHRAMLRRDVHESA